MNKEEQVREALDMLWETKREMGLSLDISQEAVEQACREFAREILGHGPVPGAM